jgi:MFS family permease
MADSSSSMLAAGVPALMVEFHSDNQTLASFVVTVFVLGFATGPLWFAPLSELYGRTIVQHTGCIGFVIFSIACALSTSLNMLIGMRLLQGIFAAVPLTNGGAIVADIVKITSLRKDKMAQIMMKMRVAVKQLMELYSG